MMNPNNNNGISNNNSSSFSSSNNGNANGTGIGKRLMGSRRRLFVYFISILFFYIFFVVVSYTSYLTSNHSNMMQYNSISLPESSFALPSVDAHSQSMESGNFNAKPYHLNKRLRSQRERKNIEEGNVYNDDEDRIGNAEKETIEDDLMQMKYLKKVGNIEISLISKTNRHLSDMHHHMKVVASLINDIVVKYNGIIIRRYENIMLFQEFIIKIPFDAFDKLIEEIHQMCSTISETTKAFESAKVNSQIISIFDETDNIFDWKLREKSLEDSQKRMMVMLKSLKEVKDILQVEHELARVSHQLERISSMRKRLVKEFEMSELDVIIYHRDIEPSQIISDQFILRFLGTVYEACTSLLLYFENSVYLGIYIIIYAVPIGILAVCGLLCSRRE